MQQSLKEQPYGNWTMVSPSGIIMCKCSEKRANWYLKRNIAEIIEADTPTIQLNFEPNGNGNHGDAYGLAKMHNRCVVCGSEENLTKHHIVPYMYRQHFPDSIKGRSAHDVVVICVPHHVEYETVAMKRKKELFSEYQLPCSFEKLPDESLRRKSIRSLSSALVKKRDQIPAKRYVEICDELAKLMSHQPTHEELVEICDTEFKTHTTPPEVESANKLVDIVMEQKQLQQFVAGWRKHFLDVMNPQYMPDFWDVNRPISNSKEAV